jgi:hypothetical protein
MIVNFSLGFWLANELGLGPGNPIKLLLGSRNSDSRDAAVAEEESTAV